MRTALTLSLILLTQPVLALTLQEHQVCVAQAERIYQNNDSYVSFGNQVIQAIQLKALTRQELEQSKQVLLDMRVKLQRQIATFMASPCMTSPDLFSSTDRLYNCQGMRSSYCE